MKRIGIMQILQETNSFNPVRTTLDDFEAFGLGLGDDVISEFGEVDEIGGFLEGLKLWSKPVQPVGLIRAQSWSGGPLSTETKGWFIDAVGEQLTQAGPLDGVLFALHGAMVSEEEVDVDGCLLETVHAAVGREVPLVATIDLHAYCTSRMINNADVILAYHTSPHMDRRQTGVRAARALERILSGVKPACAHVRLPMITVSEAQNTFRPPMAQVFARVRKLEGTLGVLSAAVLMTQSWLDVPQLGWSSMVTTDSNVEMAQELAQELAAELAEMCWACRRDMTVDYSTPEDSIVQALACSGKPVIIADGADATNSGAGGDSTHLLRELVKRRIPDGALTIMVDPEAVRFAQTVGEGNSFEFAVGGKRDHVFSKPLEVAGKVTNLQEARYVLTGHGATNLAVDMGLSATVRIGDVTLLLVERPGPGSTPLMYRCVDLEPQDYKIVVVKSPAGFRAEFEPFAAEIILSDCPGCASPHYDKLPYKRINRPLSPLDEIEDWRSVAWVQEVNKS